MLKVLASGFRRLEFERLAQRFGSFEDSLEEIVAFRSRVFHIDQVHQLANICDTRPPVRLKRFENDQGICLALEFSLLQVRRKPGIRV